MIIYLNQNNQKGQIALLVTLIFLFVILFIGIWLTSLTIKEMTMASNIEKSTRALDAANAGIEEALYKKNTVGLSNGDTGSGTLGDISYSWKVEIDKFGDITIKSIGEKENIKRAMIVFHGWTVKSIGKIGKMLSVDVGDGNNDGLNEVYGANFDGYIYKFEYSPTTCVWLREDVGNASSGEMSTVFIGDGDNDGSNEVYGKGFNQLLQFKYSLSSWSKTSLVPLNSHTRSMITDGNNDMYNEIYSGEWIAPNYQFTQIRHSSGSWSKDPMGMTSRRLDTTEDIAVGDGNNDGLNEVYGGADDEIYQFTYNSSAGSWLQEIMETNNTRSVCVGDGNNNGQNEVYTGECGSGQVNQYTYIESTNSWGKLIIGTCANRASRCIEGVFVGNGDNDDFGFNEVYATGERPEGKYGLCIYRYSTSTASFIEEVILFDDWPKSLSIGDGDDNGLEEMYVAGYNGNIYQFEYKFPLFEETRP